MRLTRVIIPALALAALLGGAPAASAAPAVPSVSGSIIAPCTPLQDGAFRWYGRTLTECRHVAGLGYYWVTVSNSCSGASPARLPAGLIC